MKSIRSVVYLIMVLLIGPVFSAENVDLQMIQRIKHEAIDSSKVLETMSYLTDVYGARLTGSPNLKMAAEWSIERLKQWGIKKAELENWGTFGKGWGMVNVDLEMILPTYSPLFAYPKAWTAGTGGRIQSKPIIVEIKSEEDFDQYEGKLAGAIVMNGEPREQKLHFEADAKRYDEEGLAELFAAPIPGEKPSWWSRRAEYRKKRKLRRQTSQFLKDEGAALILEPSQREHGTVRLGSGGSRDMKAEPGFPTLVVANEHYGRLYRMIEKGADVELAADVETIFYTDDSLGFNLIAEIPGVDRKLKKEVVMLGGHLDSWHAGTGATDNAASCSIAMEAMRILKKLNVRPRRTIRLALWSGEEQGLLGSRAYVKNHFADRRTMELLDDHEKVSVYFNLDNGAGKIRGIYAQENDAVKPIFEAWLAPFADMGAETVSIRRTGSTDHIAFDEVGIPGFQFIQDPMNYFTRTHHTNMDVYENVVESDLIHSSIIMATFVYNAAMRDAKIPRKALPAPSISRW